MTNEQWDALIQGDISRLMAAGAAINTANRIAAADRGKVNFFCACPPIPVRDFDWCATFDDDEPNDEGQMLRGWGKTEAEALEDLLTTFEDSQEDTP